MIYEVRRGFSRVAFYLIPVVLKINTGICFYLNTNLLVSKRMGHEKK